MIKDILVHLDDSDDDGARLAYTAGLAGLFDAHVTALYANLIPQIVLAGDGGMLGMDMAIEVENEARAHGETAMDRIMGLIETVPGPHDLKRLDVHSEMAGQALAVEARLYDLFVATRPYGHDRETLTAPAVEGVLFESGRPCLFLPPHSNPPARFGTVLLAWKSSRQAARAVAAAMPLLHKAAKIVVAMVDDGKATDSADPERGTGILTYLTRHGLAAELKLLSRDERVSKTLLDEAGRSGADLIVMGGYGHSRLAEWVLGGTTRALLSQAQLPVLVGH